MNLLDFEKLYNERRQELEERLKNSRAIKKNLDRMAKEAFAEIERRAEEDKNALVKLFMKLQENEEQTILLLQMELGQDRSNLADQQEQSEPTQTEGVEMTLGLVSTPRRRRK